MKVICFVVTLYLCFVQLNAQNENIIFLKNPSFEGVPKISQVPEGWVDCGFPNETPVDIQPTPDFGHQPEAHQGHTYLGLVVRDNDTWEAVGQRLHQALKMGESYVFQLSLARSDEYYSFSRRSSNANTRVNYNTPTILRIWAGRQPCQKDELLAISQPITHTEWKTYQFNLNPQEDDYTFLILEAYYSGQYPLIGNLLMDEASNIVHESVAEKMLSTYKEENDNFTLPPGKEKIYGQKNKTTTTKIVPPIPKREQPPREKRQSNEKEATLETFEDLKWVLKDNGQKISFKKGKLEKGFYSYYGKTFYQNVYLHNIISALKEMPGYRIAIAVNGKSKGEIRKRTKQLLKGFEELGLRKDRFIIVDWPDVVRAEEWVWPANINDLLIRVEEKK